MVKQRIAYLLVLLAGAGIVTVSLLGLIPIAIVTDDTLGFILGALGIIVGLILSAFGSSNLMAGSPDSR